MLLLIRGCCYVIYFWLLSICTLLKKKQLLELIKSIWSLLLLDRGTKRKKKILFCDLCSIKFERKQIGKRFCQKNNKKINGFFFFSFVFFFFSFCFVSLCNYNNIMYKPKKFFMFYFRSISLSHSFISLFFFLKFLYSNDFNIITNVPHLLLH